MSTRLPGLLLLLLTPLEAMGQAPPAAEPDAISRRLIDAKEAFVKEMQSADRELLGAINEALSDATSEGDFDRTKKLTATKEAFEKNFLLPTDGSFGTAKSNYQRRFVDARQAVEGVFDELVAEVTKGGDLKRGESLRAEKERWLALVAKRKTTKTRYQHPVPPDAVVFNGHRYAFIDEAMQWPLAKQRCEELDGYLVVFETKAEAEFICKAFADKGGTWIGITNADPDRQWRTIHGDLATYLPWGNREPHPGGNEHDVSCGFADGLFHDSNRRKSAFICEWDE